MNADCEPVDLDLPAEPMGVRQAGATASRLADARSADSATVALCVSEATTNAVLHAYREEAPANRTVQLSAGLGLGLPLIATLAQTVEVHRGDPGTTVRMTFALA